MQTKEVSIDTIVKRWTSSERPLFKGCLIDPNGCVCAQGDVLRVAGYTDKELRQLSQAFADKEIAKILGISTAHAVLLRNINDKQDGCPQDVLLHPEKILGPRAQEVLKFWLHLDTLTPQQWAAAGAAAWAAAGAAAGDAAGDAAWDAAGAAAGDAAWAAARAAARDAAGDAAWAAAGDAGYASNEIQGLEVLRSQKREPYFVKFFDYKV